MTRPDIFVHATALERAGIEDPRVGLRVLFDVEQTPNGRFRATRISLEEEGQ